MSGSSAARQVANADKILSLYEPEVRVIVRGKAGAEVEFGNTVLLGENRQGVILDYEIFREVGSGRQPDALWQPAAGVGRHGAAMWARWSTDRGFSSASNSRTLQEGGHLRRAVPAPARGAAPADEGAEVCALAAPPGADRGADRHSQARISGAADAGQGC